MKTSLQRIEKKSAFKNVGCSICRWHIKCGLCMGEFATRGRYHICRWLSGMITSAIVGSLYLELVGAYLKIVIFEYRLDSVHNNIMGEGVIWSLMIELKIYDDWYSMINRLYVYASKGRIIIGLSFDYWNWFLMIDDWVIIKDDQMIVITTKCLYPCIITANHYNVPPPPGRSVLLQCASTPRAISTTTVCYLYTVQLQCCNNILIWYICDWLCFQIVCYKLTIEWDTFSV